MASKDNDSVLHFTCGECGVHLGVDDSLAGVEAPCPKCGQLLIAPTLEGPDSSSGPSLTMPVAPDEEMYQRSRSSRGGGYSARRPDIGEATINGKVLFRVVLLVSVILLIVLTVTWVLKNSSI